MPSGTLYLVATPIGNLKDMTYRAVEVLQSVDFILAEDTRHSRPLLDNFAIKTPMKAYHQHSTANDDEKFVELLKQGKNIALISDAGTPGINDPGNKLVAAFLAAEPEAKIVPVPGVSSVTALLSVAGHDVNPFVYLGFLPHKKGKESTLKFIAQEKNFNFIFLDNSQRLLKNLQKLADFIAADRQIVIGRELTKIHESIYRGNVAELLTRIETDLNFKGEVTVFVAKEHK